MILKQYYLGCLAHASYLIGDQAAGVAAVVDPQRDVEQYVDDARELGCQIGHVFLTHFHADFIAGHLELRDREGSTIHLGARASAEFPFAAMRDGETLELGALRLEVLETPGHSPESISAGAAAGRASTRPLAHLILRQRLPIDGCGEPHAARWASERRQPRRRPARVGGPQPPPSWTALTISIATASSR